MMHPFLLLVASAWLLPVPSFGRGLRAAASHPKSRHDIPRLLQGQRPESCSRIQCYNYDFAACFHATSAECNKEIYDLAMPEDFRWKSPAPTVTPTKRPPTPPTVTKPVFLERSSHPIVVSLGRLPTGWQTARPNLKDQVNTSVRLFALRSLANCKTGWDVPSEITGVSIVPGRVPGRSDSVLLSVEISSEVRGFAAVLQGYVETCIEFGKGSLIQRLKALDPNVFANLAISTGSFDLQDVNNNPTPRPSDPVQQIEVVETFPPSPVVVEAFPVVPADEGEEGDEGGSNVLTENMWLIALAASSILLVFPCVMISRRAKKKREAAKVEAKKSAMMMNQLMSGRASGGAPDPLTQLVLGGEAPDPLTQLVTGGASGGASDPQNVLNSLFDMSGNTASTGFSSASPQTPERSANAGAIAALDSLIAVSAAAKPSQPYAPAPKPPLAFAPKNGQPNPGYVPTRRNSGHPRAPNSRPDEMNKRKNETGVKKKPTRAELIAMQEEMWAKRAAGASNLKAMSSSTEIVPYRSKRQQRISQEIVPYSTLQKQKKLRRNSYSDTSLLRHTEANASGRASGTKGERKLRRNSYSDTNLSRPPVAKTSGRAPRMRGERRNSHSDADLFRSKPRREEQKRLARSEHYGMKYSGSNPKFMPRIKEDNLRTGSLNYSRSTSKMSEKRRSRMTR
ncbi:hypothetical protein THAOC_25806 [Thalassiosira oceanica]|uniref:Uncharacterized protein n=1 Tax=Thalassiosira oceanica TaxID=159749 RepID=K0RN36_THAOC|nr:hypothetical protein THAOC_25806 [Thalassiosira oceanica]|eukprot:EJK54555.1 hypothetical protein THAOC_25806 [Thalassiosira oceanica]